MSKMVLKVAAVLVTVLALVGCAGANPTAAGYVNGEAISQAKVDSIAKVLSEVSESGSDGPEYTQIVTSVLVLSKVVEKYLADNNVAITDEQRQAVYDSNPLYGTLLANPATVDFMKQYATAGLVVSDPTHRPAIEELIGKADVSLNPRIGVWDPENNAVAEGSTGSISVLAEALG